MKGVKVLSLRPYLGEIWLCETARTLHKAYQKHTKTAYPYCDDAGVGRYVWLKGDLPSDPIFLVWADTPHALAHEFSHVLLLTFKEIGHDPREGDGEPFCYMLSQLLMEAQETK